MNLSFEELRRLEEDVKRGGSRAIMFVKSMLGEVNAARKKHGLPIFEIDENGEVTVLNSLSVD